MFTDNKVTEFLFMSDEFCKFFNAMMAKYSISSLEKRKFHRESMMSKAEVIRKRQAHYLSLLLLRRKISTIIEICNTLFNYRAYCYFLQP